MTNGLFILGVIALLHGKAASDQYGSRSVTIVFNNHLDKALSNVQFYTNGQSTGPISQIDPNSNGATTVFYGEIGRAVGTDGEIAYNIAGSSDRFVVGWRVPFDYNLYENWFALKFIGANDEISQNSYQSLYFSNRITESQNYQNRPTGTPISVSKSSYVVTGSMTDAGKSTLTIDVTQK